MPADSILDPDLQPMALADARDYDRAAEPGTVLAVWDPDARSDVVTDGPGTNGFEAFSRTGASAAAAQAATVSDMTAEGVDPAGGTFRFFLVQGEA